MALAKRIFSMSGPSRVRRSRGLPPLLMWMPGVVAIITQLVFYRTLEGLGWRLGSWRYLALATLAALVEEIGWRGFLAPTLYRAQRIRVGRSRHRFRSVRLRST